MSEQSQETLEQPRVVKRGHMSQTTASMRDGRVRVEKQRRMHKFESGMHDVGRAMPIWGGSLEDAIHLHKMLELLLYDEEEPNLAIE